MRSVCVCGGGGEGGYRGGRPRYGGGGGERERKRDIVCEGLLCYLCDSTDLNRDVRV